jgi:hypothetical protein
MLRIEYQEEIISLKTISCHMAGIVMQQLDEC